MAESDGHDRDVFFAAPVRRRGGAAKPQPNEDVTDVALEHRIIPEDMGGPITPDERLPATTSRTLTLSTRGVAERRRAALGGDGQHREQVPDPVVRRYGPAPGDPAEG